MKEMWKHIIRIIKGPNTNIMLGRWKINEYASIKNIHANHDHCGDIICRNPVEITSLINKELKKTNNKD